jgi:cytochrome P450
MTIMTGPQVQRCPAHRQGGCPIDDPGEKKQHDATPGGDLWEPPLVRGRLPFLGHALAFHGDAARFLQTCRRRHGDVFTVVLRRAELTFVLDPLSYPAVAHHRDLRAGNAVGTIAIRALGISREAAACLSHDLLYTVTAPHLKGAALAALDERLRVLLATRFACQTSLDWQATTLYHLVFTALFTTGTAALLGDGFATPAIMADYRLFEARFSRLVAGVPPLFLRGVEGARRRLAARCAPPRPWRSALIEALDQALGDRIAPPDRHRMHLGMLVAAMINTVPAAYWTLAFLLHAPQALAAVRQEVDAVAAQEMAAGRSPFSSAALKRLRLLDSSLAEALRLTGGSLVVRRAVRPSTLSLADGRQVALRAGSLVCLFPYLTHHDPAIYEEPEQFRFDRFVPADGARRGARDGRKVPLPLVPFGAGAGLCPGRFLARDQIKQFLALLLHTHELELEESRLPALDRRHSIGLYRPRGDLRVRLRTRSVHP